VAEAAVAEAAVAEAAVAEAAVAEAAVALRLRQFGGEVRHVAAQILIFVRLPRFAAVA
jgi:hypothetical protein